MTAMQMSQLLPLDATEADSRDRRADIEASFDRHGRSLYRYFAVRTGGDSHLADDLMQQLWLQALRSKAAAPREEMEFWLRRIAVNLIRAHWRTQGRRPDEVPIEDAALSAELALRMEREDLPEDVLQRREARDQLLLALTRVPSEEQELLVAHYFHGQPQGDIAERLGISTRAVEGRMYRARRTLRTLLAQPEA